MTQTPTTGLLLVMMDVDPEAEEEFNRWYWEEHVPERLAVPGILNARRYQAVEGEPKYLALYELEDPSVMHGEAYRQIYENPTPWTQEMRKRYRVTRNIYVKIPNPAEE